MLHTKWVEVWNNPAFFAHYVCRLLYSWWALVICITMICNWVSCSTAGFLGGVVVLCWLTFLLVFVSSCKSTQDLRSTPTVTHWWNWTGYCSSFEAQCNISCFLLQLLRCCTYLFVTKRMLMFTYISFKACPSNVKVIVIFVMFCWDDVTFVWESQAAVNSFRHKLKAY